MGIEYMMHVGICVRDLERSIRFYRDGLGFAEKGTLDIAGEPTATLLGVSDLDLNAVYLERDGLRIELLYYPKPGTVGTAAARPMNQPGLTHFAIRVSNLDEVIEKLVALGGQVLEQSRVYNEAYGAHVIYLIDPDGTRLELADTPNDPTR
ncbi:MAG: VOC family protein [Deltaproteobacteria bacterium]|nr:VOC family protein [Deltaproteobacteria bacterium]